MREQAMGDEFDTYASWTADAVEELGPAHAIPAGCRGSGSPSSLEWLGKAMDLTATSTLLDVGAGIGGPAEFAANTFGLAPTLCDPMPGACGAVTRLFGRTGTVAPGHDLPYPDATFDAGWALGVLCVVDDEVAVLRELQRVVKPSGSVGLLVFLRRTSEPSDELTANTFPTERQLARAIDQAGLTQAHRTLLTDHDPQPAQWTRMISEVDEHIRRRHHREAAWRRVEDQQQALSALLDQGHLDGVLIACRRT